jgi:preprotein translocase subunit SecA
LNVKIQNTEEEESTKPAPVRAAATPVGAFPQGGPQGKIAPQVKAGGPANRQKLGRNDLCWCGSGKKFKKCHGA